MHLPRTSVLATLMHLHLRMLTQADVAAAAKPLFTSHPQVDATQEADLGTKYGVNGYPTIKWFVDGEVAMDYSGGRDA